MNSITLKTTNRGLIGYYINGFIWGATLLTISGLLVLNMLRIFSNHNVNSIDAFDSLGRRTSGGEEFMVIGGLVIACILTLVVLIIAICMLEDRFYGHRAVHILHQDPENGWSLEKRTFGFPKSRDIQVTQFNRITRIDAHQGSWDRSRNVGNLHLTLVTFTSGDSQEKELTIYGLENPVSRQKELKEAFGDHNGLLVKLALDEHDNEQS